MQFGQSMDWSGLIKSVCNWFKVRWAPSGIRCKSLVRAWFHSSQRFYVRDRCAKKQTVEYLWEGGREVGTGARWGKAIHQDKWWRLWITTPPADIQEQEGQIGCKKFWNQILWTDENRVGGPLTPECTTEMWALRIRSKTLTDGLQMDGMIYN